MQGSFPRIGLAFAGLSFVMSASMSNTATTAMMLPVARGVLMATAVGRLASGGSARVTFLLTLAFSSSTGGMMTPVGTPSNLITIALLDRLTGTRIDFSTWMLLTRALMPPRS